MDITITLNHSEAGNQYSRSTLDLCIEDKFSGTVDLRITGTGHDTNHYIKVDINELFKAILKIKCGEDNTKCQVQETDSCA